VIAGKDITILEESTQTGGGKSDAPGGDRLFP
jgi:hypothetical protein